MVFKDETHVVAKKAEKRYEELAKQKFQASPEEKGQLSPQSSTSEQSGSQGDSSPETSRSRSQLARRTRYPTPESMVTEIVPSIEEQAIGFFISNHVSQPTIIPRGQYEWVTELLSQPDVDEVFRSSVKAFSLAGLANSTKNPMIMARAHAAYGSALKMTNSALNVRQTAVRDSTLISVIMLGMYEAYVFPDKGSMETWAKHVEGACALLILRGKEQFASSVARRVFQQFYGVILLVCLATGRKIPPGICELYDYLAPPADYTAQGGQWTTRLAQFITDAMTLNEDTTSGPVAMITKALKLDRELGEIKALIPKIWRYETVHLDKPFEYAYGTFYHKYLDPWIAQMWNNLRSSRIHMYSIIRDQLSKGYRQHSPPLFSREQFTAQTQAAEHVIRTTSAAICASGPQLTGMIAFPKLPAPKPGAVPPASRPVAISPHGGTRGKLHPPGTFLDPSRPTGLHHLIWPLYSAAVSDLPNSKLRQWTIDTLHFIALRIGTRQAVVLADELKGM
jgi:hypothetical protein